MPRIIITVPGTKPQPYRLPLDRQLTRLGRGSENDIVIDCPSVSVHHAEMERVDGGFRLRDLESTNGTKLDGRRKKLINLSEDPDITLGDVSFDFQLTEDEREALAHETPVEDSPIVAEEPIDDDPIDDEHDEEPDRKPSHRAAKLVESPSQPSVLVSFLLTMLFFTLAIAAFFIGLEIRHRQKTADAPGGSRSLISEMINHRFSPSSPAPSTAPSDPEDSPADIE